MKKGLLSLLAIIFAFTTVHAATLLHEPFSQSTGSVLTTAVFDANNKTAWMHTTSNSKPNTIKVTNGNMTMTNNGYMASGTTASNRLTLGYSTPPATRFTTLPPKRVVASFWRLSSMWQNCVTIQVVQLIIMQTVMVVTFSAWEMVQRVHNRRRAYIPERLWKMVKPLVFIWVSAN